VYESGRGTTGRLYGPTWGGDGSRVGQDGPACKLPNWPGCADPDRSGGGCV